VSGLLGLMLTFALARRLYDQRAALLAVVCSERAAVRRHGAHRHARHGLCFSLQIAMTALALLVQPARARRHFVHLPLLLGVGVALAVLSKGLVGILIPGAVGVLFMLIYRDWQLRCAHSHGGRWWRWRCWQRPGSCWYRYAILSLRISFSSFSTSSAT